MRFNDIKPRVRLAESLNEFAPPGSSDGGDDGFSEDTLKRLAAQWWNGDEDPRVEQTLEAAGWEIGQDEGYDNGGAFVVRAGDINGNSYISWPAEELEGVAEGVAEGSDNITAVFSGYGNYMKGRAANVFKHYGITVLGQQYDEDEDIVEYTVSGSKEALDQARAYLERSDQFGGMILKQGVAEGSLVEVSDETLTNYLTKVDADSRKHKMDPTRRSPEKRSRSVTGFAKASDRLDKGVAEDYNGEYDDEAGMADNNLETLKRAVEGIDDVISAGDNLPEWCQEKIAVAKSMLVAVWDYMESEQESEDPEIAEMYEAMQDLAEEIAVRDRVNVDLVWESFESLPDNMLYETAAWRRKEGKSAKGGLNAKGVASYRRENPGSKLQTAVTTKPSKLKPGSKAAKRRKSFCARMSGVKGPMKKPNGKPTRKALALRKWNC